MDVRVIEVVSRYQHSLEIVTAEPQAILKANVAAFVVELATAIFGSVHIRHTGVTIEIETGFRCSAYLARTAQPVEAVYYEHTPFRLACHVGSQGFRRKALTAIVQGCNLETILYIFDERHFVTATAHHPAVIEIAIINFCVDHIRMGSGGGFQLILGSLPTQQKFFLPAIVSYRKAVYRQGLHHTFTPVHIADLFKQRLINGTGKREFKIGVMAIDHIHIVLMREGFKYQ